MATQQFERKSALPRFELKISSTTIFSTGNREITVEYNGNEYSFILNRMTEFKKTGVFYVGEDGLLKCDCPHTRANNSAKAELNKTFGKSFANVLTTSHLLTPEMQSLTALMAQAKLTASSAAAAPTTPAQRTFVAPQAESSTSAFDQQPQQPQMQQPQMQQPQMQQPQMQMQQPSVFGG